MRIIIGLGMTLFALVGCFFSPSMNLTLQNKSVVRNSTMNNIQLMVYPIDPDSIESEAKTNLRAGGYKLGINDQLSITVWGHIEFNSGVGVVPQSQAPSDLRPTAGIQSIFALSKVVDYKSDYYTIDESGNIFFPLIGKVQLANLSLDQARIKVSNKLAKYIVDPQVTLKVYNYRSKRVILMGEVQQPQIIPITDIGLSLASALTLSGGPNLTTANVNQVYVLRKIAAKQVNAYLLDLSSAAAMLYAGGFLLQPEDIVYVSTSDLAQFNRVIGQLLPAAETVWYIKGTLPSNTLPGILN